MTDRERLLCAYRGLPADRGLCWAPNMDYWYRVNSKAGTLPESFRGMECNQIIRHVGGILWRRTGSLREVTDKSVRAVTSEVNGKKVIRTDTPAGSMETAFSPSESRFSSMIRTEYNIRDPETLKVMRYVAEATHYEAMPDRVAEEKARIGEDGVVLTMAFSVPLIQFLKIDAGIMNGYYLLNDYPNEVNRLLDIYLRNYLSAYELMARTDLDMISTGDNMDSSIMTPGLFREYAVPFYREAAQRIHAHGKLFAGHWCGRTEGLLALAKDCGLDIVEAVVTRPMAEITLPEALDRLEGKVTLQGGIPAVLVCLEGGSADDFKRYMEETVLPLKGRKGFVLGMSDNVPPNADFARVEAVADMIGSVAG